MTPESIITFVAWLSLDLVPRSYAIPTNNTVIPAEAARLVREVGRRIAAKGLPGVDQAAEPERMSKTTVTE